MAEPDPSALVEQVDALTSRVNRLRANAAADTVDGAFRYREDQPRVPAGSSAGGQWAGSGGGRGPLRIGPFSEPEPPKPLGPIVPPIVFDPPPKPKAKGRPTIEQEVQDALGPGKWEAHESPAGRTREQRGNDVSELNFAYRRMGFAPRYRFNDETGSIEVYNPDNGPMPPRFKLRADGSGYDTAPPFWGPGGKLSEKVAHKLTKLGHPTGDRGEFVWPEEFRGLREDPYNLKAALHRMYPTEFEDPGPRWKFEGIDEKKMRDTRGGVRRKGYLD